MSYKDQIAAVSVRLLKKTIRSNDKRWPELRPFIEAHGTHQVVSVFRDWAESVADRPPEYPLSYFLGAVERLLAGVEPEVATVEAIKEKNALNLLAAELYSINPNQAFTGKELKELGDLLATYGQDEILAGYKEYIKPLDDFELRRAARTFAQGGANAVILAGRKYREERKRQEALLEQARQNFLEQPSLPAKAEEEEFFVPE